MVESHIVELHIAGVCMMPAYTNYQVHHRLYVLPVFMYYQVHILFYEFADVDAGPGGSY